MTTPVAILVLGMHRSGTSALTGALGIAGVNLGRTLKAAGPDNPKGFWELEPVIEMHELLLSRLDRSWDDLRPLPSGWLDHRATKDALKRLQQIIDEQFADSTQWAVKDPRLCRFVPLWRRALDAHGISSRALIVSRRPDEVAASLAARNGLPLPVGRALWGRYMAEAIRGSEGMDRCVASYDTLLKDGLGALESIASTLSLTFAPAVGVGSDLTAFLTPSLRHHVSKGSAPVKDPIDGFYVALKQAERTGQFARVNNAIQRFEENWAAAETTEALCEVLKKERVKADGLASERKSLQGALDEATRWGQRKDAELLETIATNRNLSLELKRATKQARAKASETAEAVRAIDALREDLSKATDWGATKDRELSETLSLVETLRGELQRAIALGESRDKDLVTATVHLQTLQAEHVQALVDLKEAQARCLSLDLLGEELAAATRWGAVKDKELGEALALVESLRSELYRSTTWGESKDKELVESLALVETLRSELHRSTAWGKSKDEELLIATSLLQTLQSDFYQMQASLEETQKRYIASEAERLKFAMENEALRAEIARSESQMIEIRENLQDEISRLTNEMRSRLSHLEAQLQMVSELAAKQASAEELSRQAGQLNARVANVESMLAQMGFKNALRRISSAIGRRAMGLTKKAVIAFLRVLPGSPRGKQARLDRLRVIREICKQGVNSRSILWDIQSLARRRWPAIPAYTMRTPLDSELPAIDVSVVLYESHRWVPAFVESLLSSDYPLEKVHLLIRDHSDSVSSFDALEHYVGKLRSVLGGYSYSRGPNAGYGAGHNHNFGMSQSALFLATNVDGRFRANSLRSVARAAVKSHPSVAAWELRQAPYEHPKYYDPVTLLTTWVSGACVMFRREAFAAVRGFDDWIFMYGEDVDLSFRLRAKGYDLVYVPHAVFEHDSYSEPGEFKPLQYYGSTLANALLRLRFGTLADIAAIPFMWKRLAIAASNLNQKKEYRANLLRLLRMGPRFLLTRPGLRRVRVPFIDWDYGLRRDGAFEVVEPAPQPQIPVSIIVRTYRGREALLRQALATIANQTYENVEAVVVEDQGSALEHFVYEVCSEFGLKVQYLSCIEGDSNRCTTGSRGMAAAFGEYLNFLDDDDLLFADHVEYLVSRMQANPGAPACYALTWEARVAPDNTRHGVTWEVMHSTIDGHRRKFDREILSTFNFMPIQSVMFHRSLYSTYGGLDPRLDNLEDWELWRRYSLAGDFQYCPKTTSIYHVPHDPALLAERQRKLDSYLPMARRVAEEARAKFHGHVDP